MNNINEKLTYTVVAGFMTLPHKWTTEFCAPCFSYEEALAYKEKCEKYYNEKNLKFLIVEDH